MYTSNPEVKSFFRKYLSFLILSIVMSIGSSLLTLNIIKDKVVENNQAIIGKIVTTNPELESEIVDIITQGKSSESIESGVKILNKYNYDKNINLHIEPIISQSLNSILGLNIFIILIIFLIFLILILNYFRKIYEDINEMKHYVYHSSEGRSFYMKNVNEEGQIGLLKVELTKMTNILKEKVELLNKEKVFLNNTISDISHQLKTPMTSLMILNDLMYDDLNKEVKVDFLDKIKHQLNRMDWLIKSMLKLSKVEAKVINFKKEKIKMKKLINKSVQPILIPMEIKNVSLSIEGDNEASYIGDVDWSAEALTNIIKNCVEHTGDGGNINISFKENPLFSEIIIKDSGEGIDKGDIQNIFKRFYRGKSSSKEDSVGIGLSMAKSIIESQNGNIFVKSEKNKGTEFHITFHKNYSD